MSDQIFATKKWVIERFQNLDNFFEGFRQEIGFKSSNLITRYHVLHIAELTHRVNEIEKWATEKGFVMPPFVPDEEDEIVENSAPVEA